MSTREQTQHGGSGSKRGEDRGPAVVRDGRGRIVRVMGLGAAMARAEALIGECGGGAGGRGDAEQKHRAAELRRAARKEFWRRIRGPLGVQIAAQGLIVALVLWSISLRLRISRPWGWGDWIFVVQLLLAAVVVATVWRQTQRSRAGYLADVFERQGLCPTCAYPLAELPVQGDGCRVCPECGGAWLKGAVYPINEDATALLNEAQTRSAWERGMRRAGRMIRSLRRPKG